MANNRNPPSSSTSSSSTITASRQGVPLKPALARAPLTPRLPQDPSTSSSAPHFRPKLQESDFRPKLSDSTPAARHRLYPSSDPNTRPPTHDTASHVTPRPLMRKTRVDHLTNSTPATPNDDTPSHAKKRPLMISPTNSEPAVRRPQTTTTAKAKSVVGSARPIAGNAARTLPTARPTVRGFVKTQDTVKSPTQTLHPHVSAPSTNALPSRPTSARASKDPASMFFHASDAKSQPPSQERPTSLKKTPSFFYANGQHQELNPRPLSHRSSSPVLSNVSAVSESRSPQLFVQSPLPSDSTQTPPLASPPLSAVSSRSNNFPSPNSPPKNNIHLSYRKGASQIFGLGGPPLPFHPAQPSQRKTSASSLHTSHLRSSSLSSIDTGSPDHIRRPSHPVPHIAQPVTFAESPTSPTPAAFDLNADTDVTSSSDTQQSTDKQPIDVHAEARRERKVLDLEISNSSLLAINKSLERELRKQKAELKRFRRLSRAGQFPVPQRHSSAEDLSALDEEGDLPEFDDDDDEGARPSSPFQEQPSEEFSDEESTGSSAAPLSPGAQAARDAAHRAEDENRLRLDLSKHRELLLDTQRMNQSLQRCLYWTEGLIKDGKKALEYQVASSDVKLGGHILSGDDLDDNSSQVEYPESVQSIDEQLHTKLSPGEPDRRSVGSEMDSGIDLGKRGPLTMARDNPHRTRPAQQQ